MEEPSCDGTLLKQSYSFRYSGVEASISTCFRTPPLQTTVTWRNLDGKKIDPAEEWRNDFTAFSEKYNKLDPVLWNNTQAEVDVDVWFAIEERDLPKKEFLTQNPLLRATAESSRSDRISLMSAEIRSSIQALVPAAKFAEPLPIRIPRLTVRVPAGGLKDIGKPEAVVRVMPAADHEKEVLQSENYIPLGGFDTLWYFGWDGSGVSVAMLEGGGPDGIANLDGIPFGGNCSGGTMCACAAGTLGPHMRRTMGIVRNSVTAWGGAASDVTTLPANFSATGCSLSGAAQWALGNGASVINRSACGGPGSPQTGTDLYLDYLASNSPWPTVVGVAGNSALTVARTCMNLHNGVVVGAAVDNGSSMRSAATMAATSQYQNWNGAAGWELPHVVAPGNMIDTADKVPYQVELVGVTGSFTSYSAPQVAGVAAAVQEVNSTAKVWPELFLPAVLVGADENVDAGSGGVWPLNLHDGVDDRDGAGLLNGWLTSAMLVPSNKRDGGNAASPVGHDYGTLSLATNGWYPETYNARVQPDAWLRVGLHAFARPTCGSPATISNCTGAALPMVALVVSSPPDFRISANLAQTYQYVAVRNTSAVALDYSISIYQYQSGIPATTFGLAWLTI